MNRKSMSDMITVGILGWRYTVLRRALAHTLDLPGSFMGTKYDLFVKQSVIVIIIEFPCSITSRSVINSMSLLSNGCWPMGKLCSSARVLPFRFFTVWHNLQDFIYVHNFDTFLAKSRTLSHLDRASSS